MKTRSAVDQLRTRLMNGEYPPGSRLQEEILAEMLGISRTPVRSALALLAQDGLLDYAPKRGFRVRHVGAKEIADAWNLRAALEGMGCRIVANRRLDDATIRTLRSYLAPVDAVFAKGFIDTEGLAAYRAMNVKFHEALLREADNKFLTEFVDQLCKLPVATEHVDAFYGTLPTARGMEFLFDFEWLKRSHDDHHRIIDAIAEGDGRRAEYLMIEHVYAAGTYIAAGRRRLAESAANAETPQPGASAPAVRRPRSRSQAAAGRETKSRTASQNPSGSSRGM